MHSLASESFVKHTLAARDKFLLEAIVKVRQEATYK